MKTINIKRPFQIIGYGTALPKNKVTSEELETKFGLPAGWSLKYSGVETRYHSKSESVAQLGAEAIQSALKIAGIANSDLGMIVSGSATFDYPLPNQSSLIKRILNSDGQDDIPCVDVNTSCFGFVSALDYASRMLDSTRMKYIAVVCAEIASKGLNPNDWETLSLFGDGAAAVIIRYDETGESGAIHYDFRTYAEGVEYTIIRGGGNQYFFKDNPYDSALHSFSMEGMKLLKLAKRKIPEFMDLFFKEISIGIKEIQHIIPHQASKMGLKLFYGLYGIDEDQQPGNLMHKGNCISASIPMLLCETLGAGKIKRGDHIFLTGTSAGFSIGGLLIRY